jgi:uncharacterized protein (TIGR03086 family)
VSDVLDRFRLLADDFTARAEAVPADAWNSMSPCEGWTARDVVAHVVGSARRSVAPVTGANAEPVGPDDDVVAAWAAARAEVESALADPHLAGTVVPGPFGEMPLDVLVGRLLCVDVLVHTWDLARAAGLDEKINTEAAGQAYEGLKPMDAMLRGPGRFDAAIEPPADADVQTRLLCFLGRRV